jgi:hypothetical protein
VLTRETGSGGFVAPFEAAQSQLLWAWIFYLLILGGVYNYLFRMSPPLHEGKGFTGRGALAMEKGCEER